MTRSRPPSGSAASVLRLEPGPPADPRSDGVDWDGSGAEAADPPPRRYVQGSLAVDFRDGAYDSFFGPQATGTALLPPAQEWGRRIIQATMEVCEGTRSADQLTRWLAPDIRERVARRGQLARRRARRPQRGPLVRALLTCHPTDGVCEVSAVVHTGGRVRALAVRMSGVDGRWLITAFELG